MRPLRSLFERSKGIFGRSILEREFAAELESHLKMHIEI